MRKDTTSLRIFLALILIISMTMFVFIYIEVLKLEENKAQNLSEEKFELTQQEYEEPSEEYQEPSEDAFQNTSASQMNVQTLVHTTVENTFYSEYELELLAHLIQAEANIYLDENGKWQYCSDDWQCYVACVALNRVQSPEFPDTLEEVIFQEGQYACTFGGKFFEVEPSERAYENARKVLEGYRPVPEEVIFQSEYKLGELWQKIGNTYFCYG